MQIIFLLAFINSAVFLSSIFFVHRLTPDLKFLPNALSNYALSTHGWILSAGLFAIGSAQILLTIGLVGVSNFTAGHILLICAGVATYFIALYKMEYPNRTYRGRIHTISAALQFTLFPLALLFLSLNFKESTIYNYTVFTYTANFIFLFIIFIFFLRGNTHESRYFGAIQKTNIVLMSLWVGVISLIYTL